MNKVEKHALICQSLNDLYARKNADYGDSFGKSFEEYGLTMACIRLEDKLNRIKSLTKQAAQVSDESIVDTLMDLANYSIMTLVELAQGEAEKPLYGDHSLSCKAVFPGCLCNTCVRDCSHGDDVSCCDRFKSCAVTECPDYVKEQS